MGRKLLIIATTSRKDVLLEMEMLSVFNTVIHVSSISTSDQLISVLDNTEVFTKHEIEFVKKKSHGKRIFVGIKKLLVLIEMARQMDDNGRANKFVELLEDEGVIEM